MMNGSFHKATEFYFSEFIKTLSEGEHVNLVKQAIQEVAALFREFTRTDIDKTTEILIKHGEYRKFDADRAVICFKPALDRALYSPFSPVLVSWPPLAP